MAASIFSFSVLGGFTGLASACDCDHSCQESCAAGKSKDCKCKDASCSKGHKCEKCAAHKKDKAPQAH